LRFDHDLNYMTGVDRRERPQPGPVSGVVIDSCRSELSVPRSWPRGVTEWINYDCRAEDEGKNYCMLDEADSMLFRTGVAGLERPVHWIYEQPPLEPALSLHGYHTVSLVGVTWRFQLELHNAGPGIARNVKVVLHEESADVTIPDPDCSFGYLLVGEMSCGEGDVYTVDLTNHPDGTFSAWLEVTYEDLRANRHQVRIDTELDPWNPTEAAPALTYALSQNYPNPFNPVTTIKYQIPVKQMVTLSVFDVTGRLIRTLVNEYNDPGFHAARWDGKDGRGVPAASGIYFSRLQAGSYTETRRMVLLR
jgi:FlgD Ig-like domain